MENKRLLTLEQLEEIVKEPDGNNHCVYHHDVIITELQDSKSYAAGLADGKILGANEEGERSMERGLLMFDDGEKKGREEVVKWINSNTPHFRKAVEELGNPHTLTKEIKLGKEALDNLGYWAFEECRQSVLKLLEVKE